MIAAVSSLSSEHCFSNSSLPCLTISLRSSSPASCETPRGAGGGASAKKIVCVVTSLGPQWHNSRPRVMCALQR